MEATKLNINTIQIFANEKEKKTKEEKDEEKKTVNTKLNCSIFIREEFEAVSKAS